MVDEFFTEDVLRRSCRKSEVRRGARSGNRVVIDKAQSAQARARQRARPHRRAADPQVSDGAARYLSRRAVRFLSSCGGEACRAFESTVEESRMLGAPLLLSLGTSSLRLDGALLNRLGDIACGSGPRQTRLLASEALHALVLVAIGRTTSHPNQHGKGANLEDSIYASAWPYVCSLASHSDSIIRALFELLLQCCDSSRTETAGNRTRKQGGAYLVDALFEAWLVTRHSSELRRGGPRGVRQLDLQADDRPKCGREWCRARASTRWPCAEGGLDHVKMHVD